MIKINNSVIDLSSSFIKEKKQNIQFYHNFESKALYLTLSNLYQQLPDNVIFDPLISFSFYFNSISNQNLLSLFTQQACILIEINQENLIDINYLYKKMYSAKLYPRKKKDIDLLIDLFKNEDGLNFVTDEEFENVEIETCYFLNNYYFPELINNDNIEFIQPEEETMNPLQIKGYKNDDQIFTYLNFLSMTIEPFSIFFIRRFYFPSKSFVDNKFMTTPINEVIKTINKHDILKLRQIEKENSGSFSSVTIAMHKPTGRLLALKKMKISDDHSKVEKKVLESLSHPCIVPYLGFYFSKYSNYIYLVLEFMTGGTLKNISLNIKVNNKSVQILRSLSAPNQPKEEYTVNRIASANVNHNEIVKLNYDNKRIDTLDPTLKTKIVIQVLFAIDYLHSIGIIHMDIKPENILLNSNGDAFLSDFGSSVWFHENKNISSDSSTYIYQAPEQLDNSRQIRFQRDLYPFGYILYAMAKGEFPESKTIYEINEIKELGIIPKLSSKYGSIIQIYEMCLQKEPIERSTSLFLLDLICNKKLFFSSANTNKINDLINNLRETLHYKIQKPYIEQILESQDQEIEKVIHQPEKQNQEKIKSQDQNKKFQQPTKNTSFSWDAFTKSFNLEHQQPTKKTQEQKSVKSDDYYYDYDDDYEKEPDNNKNMKQEEEEETYDDNYQDLERIHQYSTGHLNVITDPDLRIDIQHIIRMAKQGDAACQFQLGYMYYEGSILTKDNDKALHFFQKAASQNHNFAKFYLGLIYSKNNSISDIDKSMKYFKEAADDGFDKAQYNLGRMFSTNKTNGKMSLEMRNKKAKDYFLKSASRGNVLSYYDLGMIYLRSKEYDNAKKYFETGSSYDNSRCQYQLALMYFNNQIPTQDENEKNDFFKKYFKLAKTHSDQFVQFDVACAYLCGSFEKKNIKKAFDYFQLSGNEKHMMSLFCLGMMYLKGADDPEHQFKLEPDRKKAKKLIKWVANLGLDHALYQMGILELEENKIESAIDYLDKAVDKNDHRAMFLYSSLLFSRRKSNDLEISFDVLCELNSKYDMKASLPQLKEYYIPQIKEKNSSKLIKNPEKHDNLMKLFYNDLSKVSIESFYRQAQFYEMTKFKNLNKALLFYKKAAEAGNCKAQYRLARLISPSSSAVKELYSDSSKSKYPPSLYELGKIFYSTNEPTIALNYLKESFKLGFSEAGFLIAQNMEKSDKDRAIEIYKEAASVFSKSAEQRLIELKVNCKIDHPRCCLMKETDHDKPWNNHFYECIDCGIVGGLKICCYCARTCHSKHRIIDIGIINNDIKCNCTINGTTCSKILK